MTDRKQNVRVPYGKAFSYILPSTLTKSVSFYVCIYDSEVSINPEEKKKPTTIMCDLKWVKGKGIVFKPSQLRKENLYSSCCPQILQPYSLDISKLDQLFISIWIKKSLGNGKEAAQNINGVA